MVKEDVKTTYKKILSKYIPEQTLDIIADWVLHFNFNLKITVDRTTKMGDYRHPHGKQRHFITINHNLNKFSFLITLIHEIAHLTVWEKYQNKVKPHGTEWKQEYKKLMQHFLNNTVFPDDILQALQNYMKNPSASSCSDENLLRILKKYDTHKIKKTHLEEIPLNTVFLFTKNRYFEKGERMRKRFKCREIKTNQFYLFSPLAEVTIVSTPLFTNEQ